MKLPTPPAAPPLARHLARAGGLALVAAAGAACGWAVRGEAPPAAVAAAPCPAVAAPAAPAPVIAIADDGRATLHVDQQPLAWVLEQIAAQARWPELAQALQGAPQPAAAPPAGPRPAARPDGPALDRRAGAALDEATLLALLDTDPADDVRLAALDALLERHAGRRDLQRQLLQGALLQPGPALRQAAAERLHALGERERIAALPPEPDP